jgi:hypothetical protein
MAPPRAKSLSLYPGSRAPFIAAFHRDEWARTMPEHTNPDVALRHVENNPDLRRSSRQAYVDDQVADIGLLRLRRRHVRAHDLEFGSLWRLNRGTQPFAVDRKHCGPAAQLDLRSRVHVPPQRLAAGARDLVGYDDSLPGQAFQLNLPRNALQ